jgi:hypothetical protein
MDKDSDIGKFQDMFENARVAWEEIHQKALDDLRFISDEEGAQWDQREFSYRKSVGAPVITVDTLDQYINGVANQVKSNTPTINVIPGDAEGSSEVAEVYKGLIKAIEYASGADDAFDTALLNAVQCSIGYIRVDIDYVDEYKKREKQLEIKRVVNPLSVFLDPSSIEVDGADAKWAFIIDRISPKAFKERFPEAEPVSFDTRNYDSDYSAGTQDKITIAELFLIEEGEERSIVKRFMLSGEGILDQTDFPGRYIPLVPVYGKELWIDGKRTIQSLIRKAKEPQQMLNLWKSLETEILLKQPQAPVMAAEGQLEDYADDWKDPGKSIALRYKTTDAQGNPIAPPQRLAPPQVPSGIVNASRGATDDIKATMGLYQASVGQRSNETSGVAIAERKAQGDMATYHFGDNLFKSVAQVGRVLVAAIPEVYSEPRVLMIVGKEDEPQQIGINGLMTQDQKDPINLLKGSYEVRVTAGAPFASLRDQAAQALSEIVGKNPEMMQIMGDLMFKNMDFPGAKDIAERLKKTMNPQLFAENDEDPAMMAMQQQLQQAQQAMQAMQQQLEMMAQQLESKQGENDIKQQSEMAKIQIDANKNQIEMMKLQLQEQQQQVDTTVKQQELELKARELELKAQQSQVDIEAKIMDMIARIEERLAPKEEIIVTQPIIG